MKITFWRYFVWLFAGILIGAGAILPGISGGVLAVIFGIYLPLMETINNPKKNLKIYWKMLLTVAAGWIAGFVFGSKLVSVLFDVNENITVSLFTGLVIGTFPVLWKDAGKNGRNKNSVVAMCLSFVAMAALFLYIKFGVFWEMKAGFFAFVFCGLLWGLSLIVPGLTSSSILMSVGIFDTMTDGISSMNYRVILPWLLGVAIVVVLMSKFVTYLFNKHYSVASHIVLGIVIASTLSVIPVRFAGPSEIVFCVIAAAAGILIGWFLGKINLPH